MPGIPDIALGADEFLYASIEDIYGVWKRPVANDGVRVREIGFGRSQERVTRDDKLGTRSHAERITRKKAVEFNFTAYIVPSGSFGVAPDVGNILKALFGAENVTGAGVEYTLIRDQNLSLTFHRLGDNYAESLTGCVPNTATFRWSGTDEPVLEVAGFGKEWVVTGEGVTGDLAVMAAATLKVPKPENLVDVDSIVAFDDGVNPIYDNGGVGYRISAVTPGTFPTTTIVLGTNDAIDFDEGAGELNAVVAAAAYTDPLVLATAIKTAMEVVGGDTYTVTYDDTASGTQKFTIASNGTTLSILWLTGINTLTSCAADLGYDNSADDTGALSYEADDPITDGLITTDEAGGWEAAFAQGSEILPFFPAPTTVGSPVNSITGGMTIDVGTSLRTTEGSVEYNGSMEARNDIFGEESSIGFSVSGRREVTMSITSYLESDYVNLVKEFNRFGEAHAIAITLGNGVGNLCIIELPSLEFDNVPFTVPESEEATVVFTGMALDKAAPYEGEFKVTFA